MADAVGLGRLGVGQAKPGQHLGRRLGVGGLHGDPGGAGPAQLGQRALEHQPPGAHHAHVRADLLHLGQQVRGDEHGGAVGGDLPDQRAHLAGPLRVEPVGRLVQDDQLPGPQQARGDGQPLLHAQRVVPVPLLRRREQAHPVQGFGDPGPRRGRVGGPVRRVVAGQVVGAGQERVEGRPLDQRADPVQHPGGAVRHRHAEQRRAAAGRVGQAEQHPDRGGLARPVRPEEAVDRPERDGQVDVVDRELTTAEPLGQPAGRDRGQCGWAAAAAYRTLGWTAPTKCVALVGDQHRDQAGPQQPAAAPGAVHRGGRVEQGAQHGRARRRANGRRRRERSGSGRTTAARARSASRTRSW